MDKYGIGEVLKDKNYPLNKGLAPKLTIPQQIEDMKKKGISFEVCSEVEARKFLAEHNYYFKIKAYAHNYDRYKTPEKNGQYINLDFAYLRDLSTIDAKLRKIILNMAIDLEHFLKVRMLNHFNMVDEDGYEIVRDFFKMHPTLETEIESKINTSTCHNIVGKFRNNWAIWNIIELLSFGRFIDLYVLFYQRNHFPNDGTGFLYSVKMLRNAAAHNNCLINQMRAPYSREITPTYELKRKITMISSSKKDTVEKWLRHPAIHDFLALILLYNEIVPEPTRSKAMVDVVELFSNRMPRNKTYYEKEQVLTASYKFVNEIVQKTCR